MKKFSNDNLALSPTRRPKLGAALDSATADGPGPASPATVGTFLGAAAALGIVGSAAPARPTVEELDDMLSVDASEALRAAAAADCAFLVDGVMERLALVTAAAGLDEPLARGEVDHAFGAIARQLWAVSQWDLPVHVRVELATLQARRGLDVGWLRYAAALGVGADGRHAANVLDWSRAAESAGLARDEASRVSRAMQRYERALLAGRPGLDEASALLADEVA